jgi:hypothetical protein
LAMSFSDGGSSPLSLDLSPDNVTISPIAETLCSRRLVLTINRRQKPPIQEMDDDVLSTILAGIPFRRV